MYIIWLWLDIYFFTIWISTFGPIFWGDLELCRSRSSMPQNHGLLWNLILATLAPMANYDPMECDNCWTQRKFTNLKTNVNHLMGRVVVDIDIYMIYIYVYEVKCSCTIFICYSFGPVARTLWRPSALWRRRTSLLIWALVVEEFWCRTARPESTLVALYEVGKFGNFVLPLTACMNTKEVYLVISHWQRHKTSQKGLRRLVSFCSRSY